MTSWVSSYGQPFASWFYHLDLLYASASPDPRGWAVDTLSIPVVYPDRIRLSASPFLGQASSETREHRASLLLLARFAQPSPGFLDLLLYPTPDILRNFLEKET